MSLLRKFVRLSVSRRRLHLEAVLLVVLIRLGLLILPLRPVRVIAAVAVVAMRRMVPREPAKNLEEVSSAVRAVTRVVPYATCLVRALALQVLCEVRRCAATLCIGVRRGAQGQLEAHAWVEAGGQPIDRPDPAYRTLARFDRVRP